MYIIESRTQKLVIKYTLNTFTDDERITGLLALTEAYNKLGIYCPQNIKTLSGNPYYKYEVTGKIYYIYAEEYARYQTAEYIGEDQYKNSDGVPRYYEGMFKSVGKVANAHLNVMQLPSAYCMLEPFCPPDTTDEQTECAELFFEYIYKNIPQFTAEADELKRIFYLIKDKISKVYHLFPTSCFQADLNQTNVLLDDNGFFAGLIDFNLCGKEPIINYVMRDALWRSNIFDDGAFLTLEEYEENDLKRRGLFLSNLQIINEEYHFSDIEREMMFV